jgi:DtxR family transcriptional regulator, Mn-dependent transcriptional regulator
VLEQMLEPTAVRDGVLPAGHASHEVSADATTEGLEHAATEALEILLENDEARLATSPGELAHRLPLGADVIAAAVELLVARGIARARDGLVQLTDDGRIEATRRVRRHRLTARLLSDVIGLEWWKVHGRTTSWEALVDDDVEARIVELLGDPGTCPHGNPIPGSANQPHFDDAMLLDDAPVGPVRVVRITQTLVVDDEALQLVQLCGFLPGSDVEIKARRDGWVEVAGTVRDAAFPPHMARHIVVAPR